MQKRELDGVIFEDKRREFTFLVQTETGAMKMGTMATTEEQAKKLIDAYLEEVGIRRAA